MNTILYTLVMFVLGLTVGALIKLLGEGYSRKKSE